MVEVFKSAACATQRQAAPRQRGTSCGASQGGIGSARFGGGSCNRSPAKRGRQQPRSSRRAPVGVSQLAMIERLQAKLGRLAEGYETLGSSGTTCGGSTGYQARLSSDIDSRAPLNAGRPAVSVRCHSQKPPARTYESFLSDEDSRLATATFGSGQRTRRPPPSQSAGAKLSARQAARGGHSPRGRDPLASVDGALRNLRHTMANLPAGSALASCVSSAGASCRRSSSTPSSASVRDVASQTSHDCDTGAVEAATLDPQELSQRSASRVAQTGLRSTSVQREGACLKEPEFREMSTAPRAQPASTPAGSGHQGPLASRLAQFAPPVPPDSCTVAGTLLAEARKELRALDTTAGRAGAACLAAAPLAEVLRREAAAELTQLEVMHWRDGGSGVALAMGVFTQRVTALRAAAAQALMLLEEALGVGSGERVAGETNCKPARDQAIADGAADSVSVPMRQSALLCAASAESSMSCESAYHGHALGMVVGEHTGPSLGHPALAMPPEGSGGVLLPCDDSTLKEADPRALDFSGPPLAAEVSFECHNGLGTAISPASPAGARVAAQTSPASPPSSPEFAAALGGLAADMRDALNRIRSARLQRECHANSGDDLSQAICLGPLATGLPASSAMPATAAAAAAAAIAAQSPPPLPPSASQALDTCGGLPASYAVNAQRESIPRQLWG